MMRTVGFPARTWAMGRAGAGVSLGGAAFALDPPRPRGDGALAGSPPSISRVSSDATFMVSES